MAELKSNQNGGKREGAGRPTGTSNKLRVTDFFNGDERNRLVLEAKLLAFGDGESKPDKDMVKFLFEQLFGKATQRTEISGKDGELLQIIFDKSLKGE
jgi:hypothetical protein